MGNSSSGYAKFGADRFPTMLPYKLPDPVLIKIFQQLSFADLLRMRSVCKRWQELTNKLDVYQLWITDLEQTDGCLPFQLELSNLNQKWLAMKILFEDVGHCVRRLYFTNVALNKIAKHEWAMEVAFQFRALVSLGIEDYPMLSFYNLKVLLKNLGNQLEELSLKNSLTKQTDEAAVELMMSYLNDKLLQRISFETWSTAMFNMFTTHFTKVTHFHVRLVYDPPGMAIQLSRKALPEWELLNLIKYKDSVQSSLGNLRALQQVRSLHLESMFSGTPFLLEMCPFQKTLHTLVVDRCKSICPAKYMTSLTSLSALTSLTFGIESAGQFSFICRNLGQLKDLNIKLCVKRTQRPSTSPELEKISSSEQDPVCQVFSSQELANLTELESFSLSWHPESDYTLTQLWKWQNIKEMPKLTRLAIFFNQPEKGLYAEIDLVAIDLPQMFPNLQFLRLKLGRIGRLFFSFVDKIDRLPRLKELNLQFANKSDQFNDFPMGNEWIEFCQERGIKVLFN